jgi:hypothetical protein
MPSSQFPIHQKDLKQYEVTANNAIKLTRWKPAKAFKVTEPSKGASSSKMEWRPSALDSTVSDEAVSLLKIATAIGGDETLLPTTINRALRAIRTGLCIGLYVTGQYMKSCGLEELKEINKKSSQLTPSQRTAFLEKNNSAAAIAAFCTASYVVWDLSSFEADKVSSARTEFYGVPELALTNHQMSLSCMLYYLTAYIDPEKNRFVRDEYQMISMVLQFFGEIIREVKQKQGSLKDLNFFTDVSYKLTDSDFTVQGFDALRSTGAVSVEFNKVKFEAIVGNKVAKHEAKRIAQRLVCYDQKSKKNPFVELGGLQTIRMGYGMPGTGKSLQIAATATLLEEYCKVTGIPFLFWPLPDNLISTFQGGSAERAMEWFKRFQDDNKIIYGSIDDAENVLEERTRQGVSAGVREVIGVLLRYTEGAYAINRGNTVIEIFTNLPEQVDKAVLSRIQSRFPIDGARNGHDFVDQDYMWWKKYEEAQPGFVNMKRPQGYEYLLDQKPAKSLIAFDVGMPKPSDSRIAELLDSIRKKGVDHSHHDFFGELYEGVQKIYPMFTSRDVRNIQQATSARIMDFDLPSDWFEKPELFFAMEYDTKLEMIKELMRGNMRGMSFADIRFRESIRYLDNVATIANVDRERKINTIVDDHSIRVEAAKRTA